MAPTFHFQELTSTNTWLAACMESQNHAKTPPLPEGSLVWCDYQTAGRGRQRNTWVSEKGKNLLMSILLHPQLAVEAQFRITEWFSLAVADFLEKHAGLSVVRIKWPNDIYIGTKKIAGILIEHHWSGAEIAYSILGIGLNVRQTLFPETLPNPTSVLLEKGNDLTIEDCALGIRDCLLQRKRQEAANLHADYLQRLYRKQETAAYQDTTTGECFQGMITGVSEKGLLQVRCGEALREFELNSIAYR
ncbi:MAG: biotin--[acetyl-CoA-carboxylase] ligase [Bacteroidales bacterium]|nr:biotin--[acetyl-CoA-carboxylase] ligase [Bacteroidales bacterium]